MTTEAKKTTHSPRPKVLYVLGQAYSGSTLLGVALGRYPQIKNLGEVVNLEHDVHPETWCCCRRRVAQCPHWQRVFEAFSRQQAGLPTWQKMNFKESGGRSFLEAKSSWRRLALFWSGHPQRVYGQGRCQLYRKKYEAFFRTYQQIEPHTSLWVDLSKTPERLQLLMASAELDVYVMYLKRSPAALLAGNLKRPKKTRSAWGPKLLRESLLLQQRIRQCERLLERIPAGQRRVLAYEDFCRDPNSTLAQVLNWLNIEVDALDHSQPFRIDDGQQHLYVGNRWLFSKDLESIHIRPTQQPELTRSQQHTLQLLLGAASHSSQHGPVADILPSPGAQSKDAQ